MQSLTKRHFNIINILYLIYLHWELTTKIIKRKINENFSAFVISISSHHNKPENNSENYDFPESHIHGKEMKHNKYLCFIF